MKNRIITATRKRTKSGHHISVMPTFSVFPQNTEPSTVYAEYIAEAIAARLNGQKLTRPQRNLLNFALSSSVVRDTISDLMQQKTNTVDSAQNNGYDGIGGNENRFESVTEDAAPHQDRNMTLEGSNEGGTAAKKPYATSRPSYGKGQVEQVW